MKLEPHNDTNPQNISVNKGPLTCEELVTSLRPNRRLQESGEESPWLVSYSFFYCYILTKKIYFLTQTWNSKALAGTRWTLLPFPFAFLAKHKEVSTVTYLRICAYVCLREGERERMCVRAYVFPHVGSSFGAYNLTEVALVSFDSLFQLWQTWRLSLQNHRKPRSCGITQSSNGSNTIGTSITSNNRSSRLRRRVYLHLRPHHIRPSVEEARALFELMDSKNTIKRTCTPSAHSFPFTRMAAIQGRLYFTLNRRQWTLRAHRSALLSMLLRLFMPLMFCLTTFRRFIYLPLYSQAQHPYPDRRLLHIIFQSHLRLALTIALTTSIITLHLERHINTTHTMFTWEA